MSISNELLTIAMLRKQLNELEAEWIDKGYPDVFGTFDHQPVMTDYHCIDENNSIQYNGIGMAKVVPIWELGLLIVPCKFHGQGRKEIKEPA